MTRDRAPPAITGDYVSLVSRQTGITTERTDMTEERTREEVLEYLTSNPRGYSREEAERMLVDDDLWIVDPGLRFGFTPEEAVEEWRQAVAFASALADGFTSISATEFVNQATSQLLWDMRERAEEALRRARERAEA